MRTLFLDRCRGYGTGVEFGSVLRGVLGLVRAHRVTLEANYMTLVMNVLCLESMAKELLPEYNVLDAARPLLATHRRLPGIAFRAALPLLRFVKELRDNLWLAASEAAAARRRGRSQREAAAQAAAAAAAGATLRRGTVRGTVTVTV
jgi:predicted unusual protein kinase regulating ubiquinone biosynthesis (AarF/ABC1/UbiB family)